MKVTLEEVAADDQHVIERLQAWRMEAKKSQHWPTWIAYTRTAIGMAFCSAFSFDVKQIRIHVTADNSSFDLQIHDESADEYDTRRRVTLYLKAAGLDCLSLEEAQQLWPNAADKHQVGVSFDEYDFEQARQAVWDLGGEEAWSDSRLGEAFWRKWSV